jgi:hypothetical protein
MDNQNTPNMLYLELASMEDRGITIWLDGSPSTSLDVSSQLYIAENNSYMRDYVFDKGVLREVHFDRLKTDK